MGATAIRGLSQILLDAHDGEVPADFEALEALPGVGHKTASVVMAQAFGVPAFPVDTHIHRLAARWGLSNGKSVEQTERDLKRLFPKEQGYRYLTVLREPWSHAKSVWNYYGVNRFMKADEAIPSVMH